MQIYSPVLQKVNRKFSCLKLYRVWGCIIYLKIKLIPTNIIVTTLELHRAASINVLILNKKNQMRCYGINLKWYQCVNEFKYVCKNILMSHINTNDNS